LPYRDVERPTGGPSIGPCSKTSATEASATKARVGAPRAQHRHGAEAMLHRPIAGARGIGQILGDASLLQNACLAPLIAV
jgi:hypothetical protein